VSYVYVWCVIWFIFKSPFVGQCVGDFVTNNARVCKYFIYMNCVWGLVIMVCYGCYDSLSGWWCCDVGCRMWLLIRNIMLRLSVNM
jgi:hypothetical protein